MMDRETNSGNRRKILHDQHQRQGSTSSSLTSSCNYLSEYSLSEVTSLVPGPSKIRVKNESDKEG